MNLTDTDREIIARARQLAELPADANTEYSGQDDPDRARAEVLGEAKFLLGHLAAIIGHLDDGHRNTRDTT